MMIFKKAIPRRMFLRGLGASVALPLLDGMIPAFATSADTAAKAPIRLGTVYVPNGMWPMDKWTPKTEGANFELTPTLEQLKPFRDQLLVLSGLNHPEAVPSPDYASGDHSRTFATFLTNVRPKHTGGKDFRAGVSMDQYAAKQFGKETQLASLEVSLFVGDLVGTCEVGETCTYVSTLSWSSPTTPLPMENNPRAVFERLFGDSDSTDKAKRLPLIKENRSILDSVAQAVAGFAKELGVNDQAKLTEYLDSIRDVERRIEIAEKQADQEIPTLDKPSGAVPASYEDYAKLMIDLQVLAYQTDLTRVITFVMGREGPFGGRAYPELGISDLHHTLSHHQNNPEVIDKLYQINLYHMKMFAYYMQKMSSVPDGDGSLLDHSIFLYGSGLSNGNIHNHFDLPLALVGGARGQIKGSRHIRYPKDTPAANLQLAVLDKLGVHMDTFGNSTGKAEL